MADCTCLPRCPFFNDKMVKMPGTANVIKRSYCQGDNTNCARFMIFKKLGSAAVPADLYPHQVSRAETIIRNSGRP